MYPFERREKILERLRVSGRITIGNHARLLGVSISTLHRDLKELEKEGIIRKVRGGAVLAESGRIDTHFDIRMKSRVEQKEEIARKAAAIIRDDSSIFLDHSSTTVFLAREISRRTYRNLIVLTNSLVTPTELMEKKGVQVLLTGGVVEAEFKALSGRWVVDAFQRINLHQIFVSVGAISPEQGLMTQVPFIHELLPALFEGMREINVLVDSSKFHKIGIFQLAPLRPGMTIFTDRELPWETKDQLERKGVKVIL